MSIESMAGSVGKELLKSATQKNGTIRKFGDSLGKKLLEKFGDKLSSNKSFKHQLQKLTDNHSSSHTQRGPSPLAQGLDSIPGSKLGHLSTEKTLSAFQSFDSNSDGQITQKELSDGIEALDKQLAQEHKTGADPSSQEHTGFTHLNRTRVAAQSILNHYQAIAKLDGDSTGLSNNDLMQLANGDGHEKSISLKDWKSVLS